MSLFTSDRERRLWLWTLAVMVAIYSTLGPARTLVDALRERNLLRFSFAVVVLLVVVAIVGQWVKRRPGWREIGVACTGPLPGPHWYGCCARDLQAPTNIVDPSEIVLIRPQTVSDYRLLRVGRYILSCGPNSPTPEEGKG